MTIQTAGRIFAPSLSSFLTTRRPFADANAPRHCYPDDAAGPYDAEHLSAHKSPETLASLQASSTEHPETEGLAIRTNPRSCAALHGLVRLYAPYASLRDPALEGTPFGSRLTMQARRIQTAAAKSDRACQRDMLGRCIATRCTGHALWCDHARTVSAGRYCPPRSTITVRSFYAGRECCWSQASCPPYRCRSRLPGR